MRRRRVLPRLILAALGLALLFLFIVLIAGSHSSEPQFLWLTPAQVAERNRPGPLTRLKYKFMNLTAPVLHRLWDNKGPNVFIECTTFEMPSSAASQAGLDAPLITNTDGMRAWILPPDSAKQFRQRIKKLPGASITGSPRVVTADGGQAAMSMGATVPVAGGSNAFAGLTIGMTPHIARDCVKLLLSVTSTELSSNTPPVLKLNFAVACQAMLTNSHALLIDAGNDRWLIASPVLVDASGNPIKR